jgi:hypothetical protein
MYLVGCWWHYNKCTKKNSGDQEEINSSFSASFHRKEISGMYRNIFDVFQGAKARELFAAVCSQALQRNNQQWLGHY